MEEESQQQIDILTKKVNELESKSKSGAFLDRYLDNYSKEIINQVVAEQIHDSLWSKLFYVSSFATASITTTTSELLDANGRESDTSAGNRFRPERESKFKTAFYLNTGISKSTVYITSPAVSLSSSIGTAILDTDKGFVGVKIVAGAVSLVTSNTGSTSETLISTATTITDNTTHIIEIDYYVSHAVVKFNNEIIGDISCNFNVNTFETFFPFLTSVGSSDATSVNLTMESYEFIQRK